MKVAVFATLALAACRASEPPVDSRATPETSAPLAEPDADVAPPPARPDPQWWRDSVGYQIFVRSFQDTTGDGIGDFRGILQRLDHLTDLGVDLVWLMPIHPSPSYHGYDVTDYRDTNPEYGTLADYDALVSAANARGIRIIIDLLLNHSSDRHPWFLASRRGPLPENDKFAWYVWRDAAPDASEGWARPWDGAPLWHSLGPRFYYGLFWSGMPDLNMANPAVQAEMEDVMAFWLRRGTAGFRIDAIRYLIETKDAQTADTAETHAYLKGLRQRIDSAYPGTLLLGEVWSSAEDQAGYYGNGDMLHMAFSFNMASAIVETSRDGVRASLNQMLERSVEAFAKDRGFEAPFLTNHDMQRVARDMRGDFGKLRVAAAIMLASPGTPFIYYGEEIGMVGGAGREDQNKRTPMHWTPDVKGGFTTGDPWWPMTDEAPGVDVATQEADPTSLLNLYERLIQARRSHVALRRGDQKRVDVRAGKGVVAFLRTAATGERVLVLVNADKEPVPAFSVPVSGTPRVLIAEGLPDAPKVDGQILLVPGLEGRAFVWLALD